MADDKKHKRGASKGLFCGTPADGECKHEDGSKGTNYYTVCKPTGWDTFTYFKSKKEKTKTYEAHHILCVADVERTLLKRGKKKGFAAIVRGTKWCINAKPNMIALPLWGHTVKWYCNSFAGLQKRFLGKLSALTTVMKDLAGGIAPPPFANLPQHNYSHTGQSVATSYCKEIAQRLERVVDAIEESQAKHEDKVKDLQSKLEKLSEFMEQQLKQRGLRPSFGADAGGTHAAWKRAVNNPEDSTWFKPFSMALKPQPIPFAGSDMDDKMANKIIRLAQKIWGR